jgi:hypothetical protein
LESALNKKVDKIYIYSTVLGKKIEIKCWNIAKIIV